MKKGDYVVATKYRDGDPMDHFVVGFFEGMTHHKKPRFLISDGEGNFFRGNGFRRVKKIDPKIGNIILQNMSNIERSGVSVWKWVKQFEDNPE